MKTHGRSSGCGLEEVWLLSSPHTDPLDNILCGVSEKDGEDPPLKEVVLDEVPQRDSGTRFLTSGIYHE
jgi:hypothetical protein